MPVIRHVYDDVCSILQTVYYMQVPFVDLHAQYLTIKPAIDSAIADVIAHSAFIRGPQVEAFEEAWATRPS